MSDGSFWSEVKVEIPAELGEIVAELFREEGAGGVVYDDPQILKEAALRHDEFFGEELRDFLPERFGLRVYYPVDDRLGERLARLKKRISQVLGYQPVFQLKQVQEEDWAEAWKSYFKPEHIGKIVIKPSWESYSPHEGELIIELDPGMAFGTGTHPTTRLCLQLLQEIVDEETEMLDLGTGSGILALAGAKLGAKRILATDIDPLAVKVARENCRRNGAEDLLTVIEGDLLEELHESNFNLVTANIITSAILEIIPKLARVLVAGGTFLASGIIKERFPEIRSALEENGLAINKYLVDDGWIGLIAARQ